MTTAMEMDFLTYMLKAAVLTAAFLLIYLLLLKRETFHKVNRYIILASFILSYLLPLCHIRIHRDNPIDETTQTVPTYINNTPVQKDYSATQYTETSPASMSSGSTVTNSSVPSTTQSLPLDNSERTRISTSGLITILFWTYLTGMAVMLIWKLIPIIHVYRIIRNGRTVKADDGYTLIGTQFPVSPFNWMQYIVLNENDLTHADPSIIEHEKAHITSHHSADLILVDLFSLPQWFNPAVWLIRRELQVIHEYEADEAVLDGGVDPKSYQMLLIKKAAGSRLQSITNCLHQSSIKKRITMMLKKKSNPWARAKLLFAVPVAAVSVAVFATPEASALTTEISDCKVSIIFSDVQKDGQFSADEGKIVHYEATMKPAEDDSPVFTVVEQQPEFPGGEVALWEFMKNSLHYPEDALKTGTEGRVIISFIVEKDGSISSPVIEKSPHESLSKEAIRIINSMPKWKPGMQRGQVVRVKYVLPISFRLN